MKEYRSREIKMFVESDCEEFDDIDVDYSQYYETVDLQDLPYAENRLSARVDSVKGLKVRDSIDCIDFITNGYTIKDLDVLNLGFEIPYLNLTIHLSTNLENTNELLEDLKKLAKVRCDKFMVVFVPTDDMTWQQQRDALLYILPRVTLPIVEDLCQVNTGSNRLSYFTEKEKDDDDKKLDNLFKWVVDKNRTVGSDCLFEI